MLTELTLDKFEVLKMECPILHFFQLVLGVFLKLIFDIVNKGFKIPKVFSKKSFKIRLYNKSGTLMTALMLNLFEADSATEK